MDQKGTDIEQTEQKEEVRPEGRFIPPWRGLHPFLCQPWESRPLGYSLTALWTHCQACPSVACVAETPLLRCPGGSNSSVNKAAGPQAWCPHHHLPQSRVLATQGLGLPHGRRLCWREKTQATRDGSGLESLPLLRVHELEEMVKDQETMAEQALEEEARRHREAYSKLEREKSTEIELLNTRWALPQSLCPLIRPRSRYSPVGQALPHSVDGKTEPEGKPGVLTPLL